MPKASSDPSLTRHHVLVDFENVHQVDVEMLKTNRVSMMILAGAKQKKIDTDLVEGMMEHASGMRLVRMKSTSKNAVDFALAFYLGQAVREDPKAIFHLVSKDRGYDPLISHLRQHGHEVHRASSCDTLGFSWPGKGKEVFWWRR